MTKKPDLDVSGINLRPYLSTDTRDEAKKLEDRQLLQHYYENRHEGYHSDLRRVPLWEHIFKRSKEGRMLGLMVKPPRRPDPKPWPKVFD